MYKILTGKSVSAGTESQNKILIVDGDKIIKTGGSELAGEYSSARTVDLRGFTTIPGLIDTHVHGGNGHDAMDGTFDAINGMSLYKIKEGVTSFVPTTVTASSEMTRAAVNGVKEAIVRGVGGAKAIGIFLEGPYINPKNKGAHPQEYIKEVCLEEIKSLAREALAAVSPGNEKRVVSFAIAPELPNALEAIKMLRGMGVQVRVGHSSATLDQSDAGVSAGASTAIHTYNAMSALNHREPGMVGSVLTNKNLYGEIIADLVHIHAKGVRIVADAKGPDKTILITDCMRAGGLPDGEYALGELPVIVKNNVARLADGSLAGSTATLIGCVKNMREAVGIPLADAVSMATSAPAESLGLYGEIGSLDAGKKADVAAMDECFNIKFAMVDGEVKIGKELIE